MENGPFIDDFPIKTSIYKGFSMAMLNNQRVYIYIYQQMCVGDWQRTPILDWLPLLASLGHPMTTIRTRVEATSCTACSS